MDINQIKKGFYKVQDKNVLQKKVIENPDRNILPIVIECYTHLAECILVGYSVSVATQEARMRMEFKKELKKKEKAERDNLFKLEVAPSIQYLDNAFYEVRLRYVLRPDYIHNKFKISALQNTLEKFDSIASQYEFINKEAYDELERKLTNYKKLSFIRDEKTGENKNDRNELLEDLFVPEQSIIVPILDKTWKYKIDGYSYYGVYNDASPSGLTSDGKYWFKLNRRGRSGTHYLNIMENEMGKKVLVAPFYGKNTNPYLLLCQYGQNVLEDKPENIIPFTGIEAADEILMNTYEDAKEDETKYQAIEDKHARKEARSFGLIRSDELDFRSNYCMHIHNFFKKVLEDDDSLGEYETKKEYAHLVNLESEIYTVINNDKKKIKAQAKLAPSQATIRKNLSPMLIYTMIKQGYNTGSQKSPQMFESNTTSPNPIDVMKHFQYIKASGHSTTKEKGKNAMSSYQKPLEQQLVRYRDMENLATFAPKNAKDMNQSLLMHFDIDREKIVARTESFKEVYINAIKYIRENKK